MLTEVIGPIRPPKAFEHLDIDLSKASIREGILDDVSFDTFDASKGYWNPSNQKVYDALLRRVFHSLTGEQLQDCVNIWLLPEDQYVSRIHEVFGDDQGFYDFVKHKPMEVQGVNLDGTWIIYREKNNLAMLAEMYHEIGHRVFPDVADTYDRELGANYFMFLALKKAETELNGTGLSIPCIDFGQPLTEDHGRALTEARRLVNSNKKYN